MLPPFAFQTASTPDQLMSELEKFLIFWLGPRKKEFGEPTLPDKLPDPLRRLYAFAGRWTCLDFRASPTWALNSGEGLRPLEYLERTRFGSLYFADECQQNWSCWTRARGADPKVWVKDNCGMDFYRWRRVERSLSRFLVTLCLRQLIGTSRSIEFNEGLTRWFRASEATPLWLKGSFPYQDDGISFYLLEGPVLVGDFAHDGIAFGANTEEGIRLLKEHRG